MYTYISNHNSYTWEIIANLLILIFETNDLFVECLFKLYHQKNMDINNAFQIRGNKNDPKQRIKKIVKKIKKKIRTYKALEHSNELDGIQNLVEIAIPIPIESILNSLCTVTLSSA